MRSTIGKIKRYVVDKDYRFLADANRGKYDYLSDEEYIRRRYKAYTGKELNLDNPQTFNEKIQWLKLYDRKPIYTTMVDKCEAKKYVASIIGEEYIIPTLGVWDSFDDIDFSLLPDQFVLKCTHDSGGLVIVKDRKSFDKNVAKKKIEKSLQRNYYWIGREWPYKDVKPRILAEQYMTDGREGLRDYKYFNFNGKSKFIYVSEGLEDHSTAKISFLDLQGNKLPFKRLDYREFEGELKLPENFKSMKQISDKLVTAIDNAFIRSDFYNINGNIYFSEITFSPCSGMIPFDPPEWDKKLGEWIKLPEKSGGGL